MQLEVTWWDIIVRLLVTFAAGAIVGANRSEHGRPAGLRTTVLVCLTASASMILGNLLLATTGKVGDSFVTMDIMRLPLGILTGMGFIGAGAILHRGNAITGVTTAGTLWFTTLMVFASARAIFRSGSFCSRWPLLSCGVSKRLRRGGNSVAKQHYRSLSPPEGPPRRK